MSTPLLLTRFQEKSSKRGLKVVLEAVEVKSYTVAFQEKSSKRGLKVLYLPLPEQEQVIANFQEKSSKRGLKDSNGGCRLKAVQCNAFKRNPLKED